SAPRRGPAPPIARGSGGRRVTDRAQCSRPARRVAARPPGFLRRSLDQPGRAAAESCSKGGARMGVRSRFRMSASSLVACAAAAAQLGACGGDGGSGRPDPFDGDLPPILFVTQVPVSGLGTVTAPFGNHLATLEAVPRGGDLMIRYPDGTVRNLTREAGFGDAGGVQGAGAVAVRGPAVHWSGGRALFSMVIGAATEQFRRPDVTWQIYEVTGLGQDEAVSIRRIEGQPEEYNNVSPAYGSD